MFDMDRREADVASSNIRKLAPIVGLVIVPAPWEDVGWRHEICYWCSKMVGDQIAVLGVDVKQIGNIIASEGKVASIRSDCCSRLA